MNRREAVQFLHDRHPHVIDAPEGEVDIQNLHLEVFWFGGHVSECIECRAERSLKRSFRTIHELAIKGEPDVRASVIEDFLQHVIFAPDIEWARTLMPAPLADASRKLEQHLKKILPD